MNADVLQAATFRLETKDRKLAGTAVLVDGEGTLLTCHHVAATGSELVATSRDGVRAKVAWLTSSDNVLAACDLALMRLDMPPDTSLPAAVPLLSAAIGGPFQTRVQLLAAGAFGESAPLSGTVTGEMKISYPHDARTYTITGGLVTGFQVLGGMSGSPIWDPVRGAVTGLLAVGSEPGNIGGFVSPLAQAAASQTLQRLLAHNEQTVPRYGNSPNRLAAKELLRSATETTLQRMRDRDIIVTADRIVSREGFEQALNDFLQSNVAAFPIISAAGQGKTTLLVQLATQRSQYPVWLVRGADLPSNQPVAQAFEALLAASAAMPAGCGMQALGSRCEPKPLLLLDGLNEVPLELRKVADEWLPDLLGLIDRTGWRMVFTTQRELFSRVEKQVGKKLFMAKAADEERGWFRLGQFTTDEAAQAAQAYHLPASLARAIGRQPLMFRLATPGAGTQHRSAVLSSYLDTLLDRAMVQLKDRHPAKARAQTIALAAEMAKEPSGVLGFDHEAVADAALVNALCHANILEPVEAGYRIIFDELNDFLLALKLAADGASNWPTAAPNVVTLTIELLLDKDQAKATQMAEQVATGSGNASIWDWLRFFGILVGLERRPELDAAKISIVNALVEKELVESAISAETDLPASLPLPALRILLREAILLQEGYGWREKDVYSKWHRPGTVGSARLGLGLTRLVAELVQEDTIDGAGILIDLLSDGATLSHHSERGASREATVGSFALCMLLAHRERIGLGRVFKEVILVERQGGDSLLEALCEDEPSLVAEQLEQSAQQRPGPTPVVLRKAWMTLLEKAEPNEEIRARIRNGLLQLIDRLDDLQLQEMFIACAPTRLLPPETSQQLFNRIVASHCLHEATLVAGVRTNIVGINDALAIAKRLGLEKRVVLRLTNHWKPDDPQLSLDDLVPLLKAYFPPREKMSSDVRYALEEVCYRTTLEQAKVSQFCDYLEKVLAVCHPDDTHIFVYPAFSAFGDLTPGQAAFREWLGLELSKMSQVTSIASLALKKLMSINPMSNEVPPLAFVFARSADPRDVFWFAEEEFSPVKVRAVLNAILEETRRRGDQDGEKALLYLLEIFEDDSLTPAERKDRIWKAIMSGKLSR
ncbi:serine protease [Mesorhizobium sp. GbtcB19]|uniref:serine protease n=1 Tax=Mesorhizobium sp. GbtcB19 TaxID=2824764 RepID=UPI001C30AD97|nr:serine protease [Mesorhizobium sp. GbtcB19]